MERMTITDFAAAAGVSRQAIYKRLDKDLAPYCQTVDGKKLLDAAALSLFRSPDEEPPPAPPPEAEPQPEGGENGIIAALNARIEDKDKEIAYLREMLEKEIDNNAELQRNYQLLLAQQQKVLELSAACKSFDNQFTETCKPVVSEVDSERKISLIDKIKRLFTG